MDEVGEISDYVQDVAGNGADIILGTGADDSLDQDISVTVIATGFHENTISELVAHKNADEPVRVKEKTIDLDNEQVAEQEDPKEKAIKSIYGENDSIEISLELPDESEDFTEVAKDLTDEKQAGRIDDMHDVPAYLRNKKK
jgi:cell division protein FtsZ